MVPENRSRSNIRPPNYLTDCTVSEVFQVGECWGEEGAEAGLLRLRWVRGELGFMGSAAGPESESPLAICGFPGAPRGFPGLLILKIHASLSGERKSTRYSHVKRRVLPQMWVFPRRGAQKYPVLRFQLEKKNLDKMMLLFSVSQSQAFQACSLFLIYLTRWSLIQFYILLNLRVFTDILCPLLC